MHDTAQTANAEQKVTVLWQPEPDSPWELLCYSGDTDHDAAQLVKDALADAPDGAKAFIEREGWIWKLHLVEPPSPI